MAQPKNTTIYVYTREVGKSKMKAKVGLALACLNIKKIGKSDGGEAFLFFAENYFDKDFSLF